MNKGGYLVPSNNSKIETTANSVRKQYRFRSDGLFGQRHMIDIISIR